MKFLSITSAALLLSVPLGWCRAADTNGSPRAGSSEPRIARLIEQLGDTEFAVRQRAQQELIKLGFEAFDALSDAENNDDPEIAMQAGYLVRLIRIDWTREGDPKQVQTILKDYDAQTNELRLSRIRQLAELPDDLGLEWLCRLVRFEKSPVLSKQAALAIIGLPEVDEAGWARRSAILTRTLERGRRPAVQWLSTHLQAHHDPAGALEKWSAVVATEQQLLEQHPQETNSQIVTRLLRRKVDLLDRLGRTAEIGEAMHQMVLCERGETASLAELIDWLAQRKAWNVLDEVATRFGATFEADAVLMYTLCEARLAQGNKELAEQTAEKALQLSGDKPLDHMQVAARLIDRGLTEWSDRELRYVIKLGPIALPAAIKARLDLSESLHDRMVDQEAGEVLKELMDAADKDPNVESEIRRFLQQFDKSPNLLRARMYYYFACQAASQQDVAAQHDFLDKAIEQDPSDVDALIALYRLTKNDAPARATVVGLIKKVVDDCRKEIEEAPDEQTYYNQIAWIVANTEGDIDEAIRLSHKSVDLARAAAVGPTEMKRVGGLLDTLGHCYNAKGDFENAVKYQSEAAKLDPHTKAIVRQLNVFRESLAKQQAEKK